MTHSELQELWVILEKSVGNAGNDSSSPANRSIPAESTLDYDDFIRIANLLDSSSKGRRYFTALTFAKLTRGTTTKIAVVSLFNYIVRKEWFLQTKVALSLYDVYGNGCLTEQDMENYITELMPTLNEIESLEERFHPFYVCIATRIFFFFLDPQKTGRIKINDVLSSGFLDSILELREEEVTNIASNWFSSVNAQRLYDIYVSLDTDQNGMLSKEEVKKFGQISSARESTEQQQTFTDVFIDRLFEESVTYSGEIDFKVFVDLVLALENKKTPASLHYFFKILDHHSQGFLDGFSMYFFYRDIMKLLKDSGQDVISFEDIHTEILDIIKPKNVEKITLEDLIRCGQGDVVVTLLTDFRGFADYESRENQVPARSDVEDQEEDERDQDEEGEPEEKSSSSSKSASKSPSKEKERSSSSSSEVKTTNLQEDSDSIVF
jgi:Ca2+-binding EF-hand superfamily protein